MRSFDSEVRAIAWLKEIAENTSDEVFDVRLGYHDLEESLKTYEKKKYKGSKTFPFRIDLEILIGDRLASIGCDMGKLRNRDE